jgi:WD40 repeat protein
MQVMFHPSSPELFFSAGADGLLLQWNFQPGSIASNSSGFRVDDNSYEVKELMVGEAGLNSFDLNRRQDTLAVTGQNETLSFYKLNL